MEPEQYEKLLEELPRRLKALFVVAYRVGTRKGELRKIRIEQVDFEAKIIRIEKAQAKGKNHGLFPSTETWSGGSVSRSKAPALAAHGSSTMGRAV